jgi:hypothetical protein
MWPSLLRAAATEAIANPPQSSQDKAQLPSPDDAEAFLDLVDPIKMAPQELNKYAVQVVREDPTKLLIETQRASGSWIARSVHLK